MKFILEVATTEDAGEIFDLLFPDYFNESVYSTLEVDPENTRMVINEWLDNICIVAKSDGRIVGLFSMFFARTFFKQLETHVEMFYVSPDFRGTGVSRALVDTIVLNAEKNGASIIYTTCACGISDKNDKMYTNLFRKFGFHSLGTELIRIKDV